jgi:hypothetical protein
MFRGPSTEWWRGIITMSDERAMDHERCLPVAVNA